MLIEVTAVNILTHNRVCIIVIYNHQIIKFDINSLK